MTNSKRFRKQKVEEASGARFTHALNNPTKASLNDMLREAVSNTVAPPPAYAHGKTRSEHSGSSA